MKKLPNLNLVPRRDKTDGHLLLCYRNSRTIDGKQETDYLVSFYDFNGRYHDQMRPEWYYRNTVPITLPNGYFEGYISEWEGESVPVLRKVLNKL